MTKLSNWQSFVNRGCSSADHEQVLLFLPIHHCCQYEFPCMYLWWSASNTNCHSQMYTVVLTGSSQCTLQWVKIKCNRTLVADYSTNTVMNVILKIFLIIAYVSGLLKPTTPLTHLPLDKMAAISQTIFSDAFSLIKSFEFWLIFHRSLLLKVQQTMTQHWFS